MPDRVAVRIRHPEMGVLLDVLPDGTVRYGEGVEPSEVTHLMEAWLDSLEVVGCSAVIGMRIDWQDWNPVDLLG